MANLYEFIDTNEMPDMTIRLPDEAVSINGVFLDNEIGGFTTVTVSGRDSLAYDITSENVGSNGRGELFLGKRLESRNLTINFKLVTSSASDLIAKFTTLKSMLSGDLIVKFNDDINKYYKGTLSEIDNPPEGALTFVSSFEIYCADPICYSENPKGPYTATQGSDGRYSVTVVNEGNVNAPITMTATMNAENGYVGMYTDYDITEIGNKEEADGQDYQQTETFLDTTTFNEDNWSNWSGTYTPDHRFDLSGTLAVSGVAGQKGLQKETTGANTGLFNGGCKVYTLPADSEGKVGAKNFYAWWDTFFWAGKMGQTAVQDIIFWSSNEIIARWLVLKTDKNGNSAVCRASYNDGAKIQSIPNYNFGFKSSHLNTQNPFSASRGSMDFLKEGAKLQFYYSGRYYAVNVPALADKKVTKVSIVLANYNKRTGNNYVTHNAIQRLQIRKLKVDKWRDVPNRYSDGDIVKMTGADSKVYVNGLPKLSEKVDGSNLFTIPPGETTIYFQCSDWCTTAPTYQIEFSEANL